MDENNQENQSNTDLMTPLFLSGRTTCVTQYEAKDLTIPKIKEIIQQVAPIHQKNKRETRYLENVYKGLQNIRFKEKDVREEINNKITENNAYEFVEFKKGFVFGKPIQYTQRNEDFADEISVLNNYMNQIEKPSLDNELAEDWYICGRAFRYIQPQYGDDEEPPFKTSIIDKDKCEIVYNSGELREQVLAIIETPFNSQVVGEDGPQQEYTIWSVYTDTWYYQFKGSNLGGGLRLISKKKLNVKGHRIIEYYLNKSRLGIVEVVDSLIHNINVLESNDMDSVVQFVNAYIVFLNANVDMDTFQDMKREGAILLKSDENRNADAKLLAEKLSQADTQVFYDRLYEACLRILGIPSTKDNVAQGSTGQANLVGTGWTMAETRANQDELMFKKAEKKFLAILIKMCNQVRPKDLGELKVKDIDIKFTRNKSDSLLVKTQGLMNLKSAQVDPKVAFDVIDLFSDPNDVYETSKKYYGEENFWQPDAVGVTEASGSDIHKGSKDYAGSGVGQRDTNLGNARNSSMNAIKQANISNQKSNPQSRMPYYNR